MPKQEGVIHAAAGTAAHSLANGPLGPRIEAAMTKAVTDCFDEGITDDDSIRKRKLEAREAIKAEFKAEMEAAAETLRAASVAPAREDAAE